MRSTNWKWIHSASTDSAFNLNDITFHMFMFTFQPQCSFSETESLIHICRRKKKKTIFLLGEYQNNVGTPNAQWMELTNTQMCVVVWKQIYVSSVFVLKNNRMNELCLLIDSAHKIYQCFNTCCYCCCCCCLYRRFRTFQWVVITENGSTM